MQQYKDALNWYNMLLNESGISEREDVQCMARILSLIVYHEIGQTETEHIIRNSKRFLTKRHRLNDFEKLIFYFFEKKVLKLHSLKDLPDAYKQLKTTINQKIPPHTQKILQESFDFDSWLESKIQEKPFAKVVREKWEKTGRKNTVFEGVS